MNKITSFRKKNIYKTNRTWKPCTKALLNDKYFLLNSTYD